MKVPPKRKGNPLECSLCLQAIKGLNESPSEKEGKSHRQIAAQSVHVNASMKVPPKRKGNPVISLVAFGNSTCLNESPSEKEGKLLMWNGM